jgi:hypothetical protein
MPGFVRSQHGKPGYLSIAKRLPLRLFKRRAKKLHTLKQHLTDMDIVVRLRGERRVCVEPEEVHAHRIPWCCTLCKCTMNRRRC